MRSGWHMDVNIIRSRFIQENLRRVVQEQDRELAARAARAFRIYFQWFESKFPDLEKLAILSQLARLEEAYPQEAPPDSAHGDRVGHHLQETRTLG